MRALLETVVGIKEMLNEYLQGKDIPERIDSLQRVTDDEGIKPEQLRALV